MPNEPAEPNKQPIQRWRSPAALRVESLVMAALGVTVGLVFLPLWYAIPLAVLLAAVYGGAAAAGSSVTVDRRRGVVVFRFGVIVRRIRLADVTAVLVDQNRISLARSAGGEISLNIWSNSQLSRWLRVPAVATDIGHAIASAVALAQHDLAQHESSRPADPTAAGQATPAPPAPPARAGTSARARSVLSAALLGAGGLLSLVTALLVRVHWHNPAMTVLAVILALGLGVFGLFYLLVALWILLTRRAVAPAANRAGADRSRAAA